MYANHSHARTFRGIVSLRCCFAAAGSVGEAVMMNPMHRICYSGILYRVRIAFSARGYVLSSCPVFAEAGIHPDHLLIRSSSYCAIITEKGFRPLL